MYDVIELSSIFIYDSNMMTYKYKLNRMFLVALITPSMLGFGFPSPSWKIAKPQPFPLNIQPDRIVHLWFDFHQFLYLKYKIKITELDKFRM